MAEHPGGGAGGGSNSSRRRSRRDSTETVSSLRGTPSTSKDRRAKRNGKPVKERWLLTRKTWRYMADAGRRLIPDGTHNRPEDIPKIEQYFQEVCQKEPRFLLWRKASYPGTLAFRTQRRRRQVKDGSCRTQASSADEADDARSSPQGFVLHATTSGKFDLTKAKKEWLLTSGSGGSTPSSPVLRRKTSPEDTEARELADMLQKYLNMQGDAANVARIAAKSREEIVAGGQAEGKEPFDYRSLIDKLQQHLDTIVTRAKHDEAPARQSLPSAGQARPGQGAVPTSMLPYQGDYVHKSLMETLSRYYSKSPSREHVISDILTDRKLLEKLYFDLRCTRGFRGPRATGAYSSPSARWWSNERSRLKDSHGWSFPGGRDPTSIPPLIAVQGPSTDRCLLDNGVQTDPIPRDVLDACLEKEKEEASGRSGRESFSSHKSGRRRSSVDNEDVSPSVGDTIKRYFRMARKKSMDGDKADRFKRVNYDRNLRNIKAKGEITKPGDDDGNNKGCQTEYNWVTRYRGLSAGETQSETLSDADTTTSPAASRNASSRSSIDAGLGSEEATTPVKHPHHQSFLSHLLHGSNAHKDKPHSAPGSPALTATSTNSAGGTAMQKSKSSSSVVHQGSRLVAKKIWRSRSKSTSRASHQPSVWTPQGKCTWAGTAGRRVTLQNTSLRMLAEVERKVLCKVAVAKLQALNLGVHIRPPSESLSSGPVSTKPKRRAYLLKRKALTTGFFDNKGKDEKDIGGLVFGIPLWQCIENDRIARIAAGEITDVGCLSRSSRHGSRTSFSSLTETPMTVAAKTEEGGSCESLSSKGGTLTGSDSGVLELSDSGGGGSPGEWDGVPGIVRQCIRHLEITGLRTLGVFRVSPSKKRVRQLREDFDCGRETKIGPDQCPHDVATLLKEYFRDLPDPLLCRDLYQAFVHTQKIRNRRLQQEALQHLIQLLPPPNRETLWALLNFLSVVAANSEDQKSETGEWIPGNKMDATNLATVFAPNILHCVKPGQVRSEVSAERAEERIDVINVMRALLEHTSSLFMMPAALLDEVYLHMMDTHPADLDIALSRRVEEPCGDEADPCSEAETFSVEETLTTSPTSPATTTTSTQKMWTREQCLHQTAGVGGDIGPRPRRPKRPGSRRKEEGRSNSVDSGSSEDPSDPRRRSSPIVITASLTIPMSDAFTLNLDDPDIPYIEEAPKQPSAPLRRQRQRSISGCSEGGRHGSDSAVGSSATLSGDQAPSSPPSWASSPPASPDSAVTAVSYIPDQQAVLQRVSFTTSSEVRQVGKSSAAQQEGSRIAMAPYTPSITSIGGAVLRSKTADIERMLQISRADVDPISSRQTSKNSTSGESKKYTKRRYTDTRHQTRHIPDADTLAGKTSLGGTSASSTAIPSATSASSTMTAAQSQRVPAQPVWKRRELISSAPKDRDGYF